MRSDIKWIFYIKHMMLMSTINKVRLVLTSIGIFAAVALFSFGTIIMNSYYAGSLRIAEDMSENTIVITSNKNSDVVKDEISKFTSTKPIDATVVSERQSILSTSIGNDRYITVMATVQGVSGINNVVSVITDEGTLLPIKTVLLKGRMISQTDIQANAKVVVIDEFTDSLLFPDTDGIGKTIEIGVGVGGVKMASESETIVENPKFEVVGIVKSSYLSETRRLLLKKNLDRSEGNIFVDASIYCPISTANEMYADKDNTRYYIYAFSNEEKYRTFTKEMRSLAEITERKNEYYTLSTKESQLKKIEQDLTYTRALLNIVSFILFVVSGISIMSIIFFSIKERIPEIGIKKAFGASKLDISFQFVFEMVFIAFFVSLFAVCISFYVCKFSEGYLSSKLFILFTVRVTTEQLVLPVFWGVLEAVLCSIVPSLYAANIKVTDSLKFE